MLAFIIFINGMCIMILEMVGARILAPWLGTSITVWTSLIGAVLAFLSLGYWAGGKLADTILQTTEQHGITKGSGKIHPYKALAYILIAAAISIMLTALVHKKLLSALTQSISSLYISTLIAAIVLFALPSLFCGMVSPFVIRLAITQSNEAGNTIGKLTAISTIGSIAGTFLGGFILISWFSSSAIIWGIALCLLSSSFIPHRTKQQALLAALLLGATGTYFSFSWQQASPYTLLETPYNTIKITEGTYNNKKARFMQTDPGSAQSASYLDSPAQLLFPYTQMYTLGTSLVPHSQRLLMLGGGGYSVPKWLLSAQGPLQHPFTLDVVEIDPGMTQAATDYFFAPADDPRMQIFHEDARHFLNRQSASLHALPYQLIYADVFNSHYTVPFHLGTQEAAQKMHDLLDEDGLVIMNIIAAIEGDKGQLLRSIYHAFKQVFPEVILIPVHNQYNAYALQNIMLVAGKKVQHLSQSNFDKLPPHAQAILQRQWQEPITDDIPPLTDDYAPVERYTLNMRTTP